MRMQTRQQRDKGREERSGSNFTDLSEVSENRGENSEYVKEMDSRREEEINNVIKQDDILIIISVVN